MPLGIFVLGFGFLVGSGIFGDMISLVAFILGFLAVCLFSAFRQSRKLPLFYGVNFGVGMIIGVIAFIAEEGSAGSGISYVWIGLGAVGSIALGNVASSLSLKKHSKKQQAKERFEAKKSEIITMIDEVLEEKERARAVHQVAREEEGDDLDEEGKRWIQEEIEDVQKEIEELQREHEKLRGLLTSEDEEEKRFAQEDEEYIKEQIEISKENLEELRLSLLKKRR